MAAAVSSREILQQLDEARRQLRFPVFDGGKQIPADARLSVYRDSERWAIIIEQLVFFPPSPGHWGIIDMPYTFGNCVFGEIGFQNSDGIRVTTDVDSEPVFLPPIGLEVNPNARSIMVRTTIASLDLSPDALERRRIRLSSDGRVLGQHVVWSLLPEYRDDLLATEQEKRRRIPTDLPKMLQLEEWNHPMLIQEGLRPSESETFRLLARAIEVGDPLEYRPTMRPNTHWSNWLGCERI